MRVENQLRAANTVYVKDLKPGDCFWLAGELWIRSAVGSLGTPQAVNLETGDHDLLAPTRSVRPEPNARVVVHPPDCSLCGAEHEDDANTACGFRGPDRTLSGFRSKYARDLSRGDEFLFQNPVTGKMEWARMIGEKAASVGMKREILTCRVKTSAWGQGYEVDGKQTVYVPIASATD